MIRHKPPLIAAVAVVTLAALVIFNAAASTVERQPGNGRALLPIVIDGRPAGDCGPAYPTVCIPIPRLTLIVLTCAPLVNFQVLPPDPHGLDADKDGIGCEYP